jgi:hypothetical protein
MNIWWWIWGLMWAVLLLRPSYRLLFTLAGGLLGFVWFVSAMAATFSVRLFLISELVFLGVGVLIVWARLKFRRPTPDA